MNKISINIVLSLFVLILILSGCKKKEDEKKTDESTGNIVFTFTHHVDGKLLETDTMKYVNAAGNTYMVNDVMYFISDVTLHKSDGTKQTINKWKDIQYIDIDMAETLTWNVYDDIPEGSYDSISFTFGINKEKNITGLYVNPPENLMAWPTVLGGGYHYMMLNGKWKNTSSGVSNLNFHLGIGQLYKGNTMNTDSIYAFVQNYFNVTLPNSSFVMKKDSTRQIEIKMNIEKWFSNPNIFDFNVYGYMIMQNQEAMQMMKENGKNVFTVGNIK